MRNSNSLEGIKTKYFSLSKTIRSLILSGIFAAAYAVLDMALIQPLMEEYSEVTRSIEKAKAESKGFAADLLNLQGTAGIDPSLSDKKQMEVLTIKLNELNNLISTITSNFIEPHQMSLFLKDLLSKSGKLTLISMNNTKPDIIIVKTTKKVKGDISKATSRSKKSAPVPEKIEVIAEDKVYKHNIQLTFRGKYADIAAVLRSLEQMHWGIFWQSLELDTEAYPYSTVSLELYTLSLNEDWLTL